MTNQTIENKPVEAVRDQAITTQRFRSTQLPSLTEPPKNTHAKEVLQMISMSVPVIGLVGTLFVWCAANLYVGDVEIVTARPCPEMIVKVYNQKGQESSYRINKFQLMPGAYRVEVSPDGKAKTVSDITVAFHTLNRILVDVPNGVSRGVGSAPSTVPGGEQQAGTQSQSQPEPAAGAQVTPGEVDGQPRPGEQQDSAVQINEPVTPTVPAQAKAPAGAVTAPEADAHQVKQPEASVAPAEADAESASDKKKWWQRFHKKSGN